MPLQLLERVKQSKLAKAINNVFTGVSNSVQNFQNNRQQQSFTKPNNTYKQSLPADTQYHMDQLSNYSQGRGYRFPNEVMSPVEINNITSQLLQTNSPVKLNDKPGGFNPQGNVLGTTTQKREPDLIDNIIKQSLKPLVFGINTAGSYIDKTMEGAKKSTDILYDRQKRINEATQGMSLMDRLTRPPVENENKDAIRGLWEGVKTVGRVMAPVTNAPLVAGGAGLNAILGDKDKPVSERLGEGGADIAGLAPLLSVTNPATQQVVDKVGGGLLTSQLLKRGVAGGANVLEDRIIANLDDSPESINDTFSFLIGAAANGNDDLLKRLNVELKARGATPDTATPEVKQQVIQSIKENPKVDVEPAKNLKKILKEEGGLVTGKNILDRNTLETRKLVKQTFPEELARFAEEKLFSPLSKRDADSVRWASDYTKQVEDLGIKKGSQDSALIQKLGEGKISSEALTKQVGEQRANKIIQANEVFRNAYDKIIDEINTLRQADGLNPIEKRKNYYRHMSDSSSNLLDVAQGTASEGKSLSIQKQRRGNKTKYDAVGGFLGYLDAARRAAFTDKIAYDAADFAKSLGKSGADKSTVKKLGQWSDRILGKQKKSGLVALAEKPANLLKKSKVIGNVSTLINQGGGVPLAAWDAGPINFIKGNLNPKVWSDAKKSDYLTVRGRSVSPKLFRGIEWIDTKAGQLLQTADQFFSKSAWNGFYEKAKDMGVSDPVKWADDATENALGSRGIGGGGEWLNSPVGKLLTPFVSEPTAQMNRLREMMGEKRYGALLGFVATTFVVNKATKELYGQENQFDPIGPAIDAYNLVVGDEKTDPNVVQAGARLIAEAMELSPVSKSMFANTYQAGEMAGILPDSRDVFGDSDFTELNAFNLYNPLKNVFGKNYKGDVEIKPKRLTGNTPIDVLLNPALSFAPAGNQASKSISGTEALLAGNVKSRSGNVMYETPDSLIGKAKTLALGPYSTKNAQDYFDNDFNRPLTSKQQVVYDKLKAESPQKASEYLQKTQRQTVKTNQIKSDGGLSLGNLFSGGKKKTASLGDDFKIESKEDKRLHNEYVSELLDAKEVPEEKDLSEYVFNGYTAQSKNIKERNDVFKKLKTAMSDEYYSEEQKESILKASGATPQQFEYYDIASRTEDEKLQEILPTLGDLSNEKNFEKLLLMRAEVGGKQLLTTGMIDYLYEQDEISKEQRNLLKAVQFDPLKESFYVKKSYTGKGASGTSGGSKGKITYKQAMSLFSSLPDITKFELYKIPGFTTQTNTLKEDNNRLIESILKGPGDTNR